MGHKSKKSIEKKKNKKNKFERIYNKGFLKKSPMISEHSRQIQVLKKLEECGYDESTINTHDASQFLDSINKLKKLGIKSLPKNLTEAKYWLVCKMLEDLGFPIPPTSTEEGQECLEYVSCLNQLKEYGYTNIPKSLDDAKDILNDLQLKNLKGTLKEIKTDDSHRKELLDKSRDYTSF